MEFELKNWHPVLSTRPNISFIWDFAYFFNGFKMQPYYTHLARFLQPALASVVVGGLFWGSTKNQNFKVRKWEKLKSEVRNGKSAMMLTTHFHLSLSPIVLTDTISALLGTQMKKLSYHSKDPPQAWKKKSPSPLQKKTKITLENFLQLLLDMRNKVHFSGG